MTEYETMRTKNAAGAADVLQLHVVNALSRALLADEHVEYLTTPGSNHRNPLRGLSSPSRVRELSPEEQEQARRLVINMYGQPSDQQTDDPQRLAQDVGRVLPYQVLINRAEVTYGGRALSISPCLVTFSPATGDYAHYTGQHDIRRMNPETRRAEVIYTYPVYALGCGQEHWELLRWGTRLPVEWRMGRWHWRPWVREEEREVWLGLARRLLSAVPAANALAS